MSSSYTYYQLLPLAVLQVNVKHLLFQDQLDPFHD